MIEKLMTKKFREVWLELSEWAKNAKILVSQGNAHQKVTSAEDYNVLVNSMTQSVDASQPLSSGTLSSPNGLTNKVGMVAGM